jgi:hypothetical protein
VSADAPQWIKDSLLRGKRVAAEKAAAREKRNAPAKNPRSDAEKEIARLWREYRVEQAYEAYNTMRITGVEPTEKQKKLVGATSPAGGARCTSRQRTCCPTASRGWTRWTTPATV